MADVALRASQASTSQLFITHDISRSVFYRPHVGFRLPDFIVKIREVSPKTSASYGGTVDFDISPGDMDLIGMMWLRTVLSAITPGADSMPHFQDFAGFGLISRLEIRQNNAIIVSYTRDQMWLQNLLFNAWDSRYDARVLGNMIRDDRIGAATAAQTVLLPLPLFAGEAERLPNFLLNSPLTIRVTFAAFADIAVRDSSGSDIAISAASGTITSSTLVYEGVNITGAEKARFAAERARIDPFTIRGIQRKFVRPVLLENRAVANGDVSSDHAIPWQAPTRSIAVLFRLSSVVPLRFTVLRPWTRFRFYASGEDIVPWRTADEQVRHYLPHHTKLSAKEGLPYLVYHTFEVDSAVGIPNIAGGHFNTAGVSELRFNMEFTDPGAAARLDFIGFVEDIYTLDVSGQIQVLLTP